MKLRLPVISGRLVVSAAILAVAASALRPAAASPGNAVPITPDARTVIHVLNRIGFGAAPGDIERVQKMGLDAYIDLQLHPERLPDEAVQARLAAFTTISMSTHDLATKI